MMARLTLVLGGARSGKSSHAEALARQTNLSRLYLATAQPFDDEMRDRIRQHRADRDGDGWQTIEEPLDLPGAIDRASGPDAVVLVDCLTLWLSNLMLAGRAIDEETANLLTAWRVEYLQGDFVGVATKNLPLPKSAIRAIA